MKKHAVIIIIILLSAIAFAATGNAATKEKTKTHGAKPSAEEAVPLVTEVMTKEELQAYLKEKNIPIITKENFKDPELVWEKTFNEPIREISDITEKGNSIMTSGRMDAPKAEGKLLFVDNKGNIRKEILLGKMEMNAFAVAKSGISAITGKWNDKKKILTISFYDEEGNTTWNKDIELKAFGKINISDNGTTVAVEEGNPNWSIEEWGGNLNISRIIFLNSNGKQLFEYKGFRNIGLGKFTGDGNYYAGLFWWQKDSKTWGKLLYMDIKNGKIQWEKPFGGNYWKYGELFEEAGYLYVSESGLFTAAVNVGLAAKTPPGKDLFDYLEVVVFNNEGRAILRVPGSYIYAVRDDGLIRVGSVRGTTREVSKGWIDIGKIRSSTLVGDPPYFIQLIGETVWEKKEGIVNKVGRIVSKKLVGLKGDVLWEIPKDELNYTYLPTKDGQYFKVIMSRGEIKIIRLIIAK